MFAALFQGPGEQINYVAMERYTNQNGPWKQMENAWQRTLVEIEIKAKLNYEVGSNSRRTHSFIVEYSLGGTSVPPYTFNKQIEYED